MARLYLKTRSSAVLAIYRFAPFASKASPLAPNGGKPWLPGFSRSWDTKVLTVPEGRSSLNTLPPNESETYRSPAASKVIEFRPHSPALGPGHSGIGKVCAGTLPELKGGVNFRTLPPPKFAT